MRIATILRRCTVWPILVALAAVPVFTLPFTADRFEFPKLLLLIGLLLLAMLARAAQWWLDDDHALHVTPFAIATKAFLLSMVIATIISLDRTTSVVGALGNAGGGMVAYVAYGILAYVVSRSAGDAGTRAQMLGAMGIGALLSAVVFWAGRFGLLATVPWALPSWNTISALNAPFSVVLVIAALLACGILATHGASGTRRQHTVRTALWSVVFAGCLATMIALGLRTAWIALAIGAVALLLAYLRMPDAFHPRAAFLVHGTLAFAFVLALVGVPSALAIRVPVEISLTHQRSLQVTADTLRDGIKPFLIGTGPDTFAHAFAAHRSDRYNAQPFWNIRFTRPTATVYEIAIGGGVLGLLAFLAWLLVPLIPLVRRVPRDAAHEDVPHAVIGALCASVVMFFLLAYGVALWVMLATLLGMAAGSPRGAVVPVRLRAAFAKLSGSRRAAIASLATIVMLIASILTVVGMIRWTSSAVWHWRGVSAAARRDFPAAEQALGHAIQAYPQRAEYHLALASVRLQEAGDASHATPLDGKRIGDLLAGAIQEARDGAARAANSVAAWEQLASMYANTRPFAKDANTWVLDALDHAIALEGNNPRLYIQRAGARQRAGDTAAAVADIDHAIALKSDYAAAYYARSIIRERSGDRDGAVTAAEEAVRVAPRSLDAAFNLGRLQYNRHSGDDWARAERIFRGILAVNRDHANARYALALLLERQGNITEARTNYEVLQKLQPDNKDIRARINRLGSGAPTTVGPKPEELGEEDGR